MTAESHRFQSVLRDALGRVAYTHKAHEKARERATTRQDRLRLANVGLISLTVVFAVVSAVITETWAIVVTIVSAVISSGAGGYQLAFDPSDAIASHRQVAKLLLVCRDDLIGLLERAQAAAPDLDRLRNERDEVLARVHLIYSVAPDTSRADYGKARKALRIDEEGTFDDEEIDRLLPPELRWGNREDG